MEAMEATAAMVDTDTARGPLMPMPTMALAAMVVMEAMEATAAMVDTDTARGPLMPMPTMALAAMVVMEVMEAMAAMVDTDMASNSTESEMISVLSIWDDSHTKRTKFHNNYCY